MFPQRATWVAFAAMEAFMLTTLFSLNVWTIWTLQMQRWRKVKATLWFTPALMYAIRYSPRISQLLTDTDRLSAVVLLKLLIIPSDLFRDDWTFTTIDFFVWLTVELHTAIVNAAYPNLLAFFGKTSTGFMNTTPGVRTYGQHSTHSLPNWSTTAKLQRQSMKLGNDMPVEISTMVRGNLEEASVKSFDSRAIMISKSVTIEHDDITAR